MTGSSGPSCVPVGKIGLPPAYQDERTGLDEDSAPRAYELTKVTRSVSRGVSDRMVSHIHVFECLRAQAAAAQRRGRSHASIATDVSTILNGMDEVVAEVLVWRLAWVAAVYAPAYDPVLVATLPFCLESIAEGFATLDDLFEHIETSVPVEPIPVLPQNLPRRGAARLRGEVWPAVKRLKNDPAVLERIIDRLGQDEVQRQPCRKEPETREPIPPDPGFCVVNRWPTAVREAVVSVLETQPAPVAVPLVREIAGRLDARSVRRLAGELVHVSHDGPSLRTRVRAASSLLAMEREGLLDSL